MCMFELVQEDRWGGALLENAKKKKKDAERAHAWSRAEQTEQIQSYFKFLLGFTLNHPFFYKSSTDDYDCLLLVLNLSIDHIHLQPFKANKCFLLPSLQSSLSGSSPCIVTYWRASATNTQGLNVFMLKM